MTLRQIGDAVGGVEYAAVQMISRFERQALQDKPLARRMQQAKERMLYVETCPISLGLFGQLTRSEVLEMYGGASVKTEKPVDGNRLTIAGDENG